MRPKPDFFIMQEVLHCCEHGDLALLQLYVKEYDINVRKFRANFPDTVLQNVSLLHIAAFWNHLDIVQYLLTTSDCSPKPNIHAKNAFGQNVLMMAVNNQNIEMIDFLLASKKISIHSHIDEFDNEGENVLSLAYCLDDNGDIFCHLIRHYEPHIDELIESYINQSNPQNISDFIQAREMKKNIDHKLSPKKSKNKHKI